MPDLTILTVTHNELSSRLPRLLYSVDRYFSDYAQHYLWDNLSTDGTRDWLVWLSKQKPKLKTHLFDGNIWDLSAYNRMAADCTTKYLMAINPNTRVLGPVNLEALLEPFSKDSKLIILGAPGPRVLKEDATPHGVGGWGWVSRMLEERDFWEPEDLDSAHVQTWTFFLDREKFLEIGGFRFRNQLFDMRRPEKRFEEKPVDLGDKGVAIASEIELSVRARRLGYHIGYINMPFYHYYSHGGTTIEKLDEIDKQRGYQPLGYQLGMMGEDRFLHERS